MKQPSINLDYLAELVSLSRSGEDRPRGTGWKTREEIHKAFEDNGNKLSGRRFYKMIKDLDARGDCEIYRGVGTIGSSKMLNNQVWYRIPKLFKG